MPSVFSGSELAEELEELEELDEEELDELAELEAGELLGWLVEFEGAGAPPPPPPQPVNRMAAARIRLAVVRAAMRRGLDCKRIKSLLFLFYQSIAGEVWDLLSLL